MNLPRPRTLSLLVLTTLVACQGAAEQSLSVSTKATDATSTETETPVISQSVGQMLSVLPDRCRGCGTCARIDPTHFAMDRAAERSIVLTQTQLDSAALAQAIRACHDRAITLS